MGSLVGGLGDHKQQNAFHGPPLYLLLEEVALGLEHGFMQLVQGRIDHAPPSDHTVAEFERMRNEDIERQRIAREQQAQSAEKLFRAMRPDAEAKKEARRLKREQQQQQQQQEAQSQSQPQPQVQVQDQSKHNVRRREEELGSITFAWSSSRAAATPTEFHFPNTAQQHAQYAVFRDLWKVSFNPIFL